MSDQGHADTRSGCCAPQQYRSGRQVQSRPGFTGLPGPSGPHSRPLRLLASWRGAAQPPIRRPGAACGPTLQPGAMVRVRADRPGLKSRHSLGLDVLRRGRKGRCDGGAGVHEGRPASQGRGASAGRGADARRTHHLSFSPPSLSLSLSRPR